jgi:AraC family transcriptional regulator, arabinose operon regulatory protein
MQYQKDRSVAPVREVHSFGKGAATDARVIRALELIHRDKSIPADSIAAVVNLSLSRFRHLFKRETGMSVRYYQKLVRMEQARELLKNSFLRVKEIAAALSIGDISHFTRDYKALYTQTPSQTRALSATQRDDYGRQPSAPRNSHPGQIKPLARS